MSPRSIRRAAARKAEKLACNATQSLKVAIPTPVEAPNSSQPRLERATSPLTGRTVLLPAGEAAQYEQHLRDYFLELRPVGPRETALVQSIADSAWRVCRFPNLEMAFYALGHAEQLAEHAAAGNNAPDIRLFELQTFLKYEKQLRSLQLQESRLRRHREKDLAELRALQTERREKEAEESKIEPPSRPKSATPFTGDCQKLGFVFSKPAEIEKKLEYLPTLDLTPDDPETPNCVAAA